MPSLFSGRNLRLRRTDLNKCCEKRAPVIPRDVEPHLHGTRLGKAFFNEVVDLHLNTIYWYVHLLELEICSTRYVYCRNCFDRVDAFFLYSVLGEVLPSRKTNHLL